MSQTILSLEWGLTKRVTDISRLQLENFDVVIIGGGITGAGVAREAAFRGLKTALIEKNDFASGTSSRSSKLAHGGFRYLQSGEFKLVREATTERNWLRNHFAHNVRAVPMNFISYEGTKFTPVKVRIGVFLYDFLSNFLSKYRQYAPHRFLSQENAIKEHPTLKHENLIMIGQFYDTNIDDARLTIENVKESIVLGNVTAVNYIEAEKFLFENDRVSAVQVKDHITGNEFTIRGKQFINATGVWTEMILPGNTQKRIRPTKGVHVMVPADRVKNNGCIGLNSIDDGRNFFVINRDEFTLIGTTDTDYVLGEKGKPNQDLDFPYCTKEDCDYLFRTVNVMFPAAHLTYDDVIATWAGIRPLILEEGKSESSVSRKHVILDSNGGITSIYGGKLTEYRKMAEDVFFHIIAEKGGFGVDIPKKMLKKNYSKRRFLIDMDRAEWDLYLQLNNPPISPFIRNMLYQQYGRGTIEIVEKILENPDLGTPFLPENQFIPAEIYYILRHECAVHLIDVLCRRTEIAIKVTYRNQPIIAEKVGQIMAKEYGWNEKTRKEEIQAYLDHIARTKWF